MKHNVRNELLPTGRDLDKLNKTLEASGFKAEYRLVLTSLAADESTTAEPLPDAMAQQKIRAAVKATMDMSDADLRRLAAHAEIGAREQDIDGLQKKIFDQVANTGRVQ